VKGEDRRADLDGVETLTPDIKVSVVRSAGLMSAVVWWTLLGCIWDMGGLAGDESAGVWGMARRVDLDEALRLCKGAIWPLSSSCSARDASVLEVGGVLGACEWESGQHGSCWRRKPFVYSDGVTNLDAAREASGPTPDRHCGNRLRDQNEISNAKSATQR
jgi:hypothetical protein